MIRIFVYLEEPYEATSDVGSSTYMKRGDYKMEHAMKTHFVQTVGEAAADHPLDTHSIDLFNDAILHKPKHKVLV